MAARNQSKVTKSEPAPEILVQQDVEPVITDNAGKNIVTGDMEPQKGYKVRRQLDLNMVIPVKNGFAGKLVYQSKKTGEIFIWEEFGDEQDMELSELRAARNANKAFFINNWLMIDDPEVINFLGVEQYYKNALTSDGFDRLFQKPIEEIKLVIAGLSAGQKRTVIYRAKQLIECREIDSIKVIEALEESLETQLIER